MQSIDLLVVSQVHRWLAAETPCWLATVVATYGSSPRPIGSLMAFNGLGRIVGSLSGGCVEEDLVSKLKSHRQDGPPVQWVRYGESESELTSLGLPCGGYLDVLVERLLPTATNASAFRHVVSCLQQRQNVVRTLDLATGEVLVSETEGFERLVYRPETEEFRQVYGPRYHLLLLGASAVSRYVAEFAMALDYEVSICDPRDGALEDLALGGVRSLSIMPDDAVRKWATDARSAVLALAHDPRIDDMGLMEALDSAAFYVGAMGSDRSSASRRERLLDLGVREEALARLSAPIGLDIGSKTPPEIAVAALAELTKVRSALESGRSEERCVVAVDRGLSES